MRDAQTGFHALTISALIPPDLEMIFVW